MGTSVVAMVDAKLLGVFTALTSLALIGYHAGVPLQLPGYQQPDSEPTEQKTQSLTYSLIECAPKFGLEDHIPAVQAELARTQAAEIDDAIAMSLNSESALRKMLVEVGASDSASKFEDCSGLRSGYLTMILTAKPKTSSYRKFLKECAKCAATALRADQQPFPTQAMHLDMIEMLSLMLRRRHTRSSAPADCSIQGFLHSCTNSSVRPWQVCCRQHNQACCRSNDHHANFSIISSTSVTMRAMLSMLSTGVPKCDLDL